MNIWIKMILGAIGAMCTIASQVPDGKKDGNKTEKK